uniref:NADP-dependent oxidoreductase domain-containing protein n=1 Tax=Hemiselmis andersenii TaxID=464988 RepID=A0A7S1EHG2_HEMAN
MALGFFLSSDRPPLVMMGRLLWLVLLTSPLAASAFLGCGVASLRPASRLPPRLRGGGGLPNFKASAGLNCPTIQLNDDSSHPLLGYGTYKVGFIPASASAAAGGAEAAGGTEKTARECVKEALGVGYRFLDCAQFYGNEKEVGLAIKDSGVPRENLYLASKVWTDKIYEGRAAVREQVLKTLADLQTDYLDLYLVHWPVPGHHVEAYKELEALLEEGKVRSIGMSNYAVEDYKELREATSVKPTINQIEVNPFLYRKKTIDFFQAEGVQIQSYRALRDGKAFQDPTVLELAGKYGKSAAQILGRWCVQKGIIYIPKSVKKERMEENADVFGWELEGGDVARLDALTTDSSLQAFKELYIKCVVRDTPMAGTEEAEKVINKDITVG